MDNAFAYCCCVVLVVGNKQNMVLNMLAYEELRKDSHSPYIC